VLATTLYAVPGCVAISLVDMEMGMHLACSTLKRHAHVPLMAASARELFRGKWVTEIEDALNQARKRPAGDGYFNDITVHSEGMLHIFLRGRQYRDYVLVLVCRGEVSLGLALNKARTALPVIEAAV
jgi:hypothetical protein